MKNTLFLIAIVLVLQVKPVSAEESSKNRLIVLTDIENEPDDTQSMVRLLLYSNNIDIKGLIATTSCWLRTSVHPESIQKVIEAYRNVLPNLQLHDPAFPSAETLLSKVKSGLPVYGMQGVGEGKSSEGSEWIIKILEEPDERPLWISVWGGSNTLAQALYTISQTKTKAEAEKLISKLRVYTISDQDDSGIWIRNNFPTLFYIVTPGDEYGDATWTAINGCFEGANNDVVSNSWLAENIQQGHGPMGTNYPDVAYGMEGDTPSWLLLINNGLNYPEHPEWGSWGGRYEKYKPDFSKQKKGTSGVPFEPETREIWTNASDEYTPYVFNNFGRTVKISSNSYSGDKVTLWRWREDFQHDFAARMDWCIKPYSEANHPPVVKLAIDEEITVKSGQGFSLIASGSYDPDGDNISYLWFSYPEAGSYKKKISINSAENMYKAWVIAPVVDKKETAHFILKVSDKGTPSLSRYKRVIVTILPE